MSAQKGEGSTPDEPRVVALRYDRGTHGASEGAAPRVVAKGRGELAERILEIAREQGVPVRSDRDLVELLSACELGDEIPIEVWGAVAELLTWLWGIREEADQGPS
jgi:flagellar biosynthesis protein